MNQAKVEAYLESSGANIVVGTDGSLRENITAWGGAAWKNNKLAFEWCTGKQGHTGSLRAECEAYEDAMAWMGTSTTREGSVIVLTDSYSFVSRFTGREG